MALACGQLGERGKLLPGVLLQQAVQVLQNGSNGGCNMQDLFNLCWICSSAGPAAMCATCAAAGCCMQACVGPCS
jgi:hypothetical protein